MLEELVKDRRMLLRVYRCDCHVDHLSKRKYRVDRQSTDLRT